MYRIVIVYIIMLLFVFAGLAKAEDSKNILDTKSKQIGSTRGEVLKPTPINEDHSTQQTTSTDTTPTSNILDEESAKTTKTEVSTVDNDSKTPIKTAEPVKTKHATKKTNTVKKNTPSKTASKKKPTSKGSNTKKHVVKSSPKAKHTDYVKNFHLKDYVIKVVANEKTFCSGFIVGKKVILAPYPCFNFIKKNGYKVEVHNHKNEKFHNVSFFNLATNVKLGFTSQWALLITDKEIIHKSFLQSYTNPIDQDFLNKNELFMTGVFKIKNDISFQSVYGCKLSPSSIYNKGNKLRIAIFVKCNKSKDAKLYTGAALLAINKQTQKIQLLGIKMDTKKDKKTNSLYSIILPTYAINAIKNNIEKQDERKKVIEL